MATGQKSGISVLDVDVKNGAGGDLSLRELLEAKLEGVDITAPTPEEPVAPVVDLMEALRASVAAAKGKEPAGTTKKAAPRKRSAASR